ncbi:PAS domain S-box protein [Desulfolutivibrio sulfoxidireducens]|nr:PAS domain S-box protein [Desulfolutivibrio sulfoxidireducens]
MRRLEQNRPEGDGPDSRPPPDPDRVDERLVRLTSMMEALDEHIAYVDAGGVVREINRRFLDFLGRPREAVMGRELAVLGLDTENCQTSAFFELFRKGALTSPVAVNQRLGEADVAIRIQPVLRPGQGEDTFEGIILSVIDVTPLVEAKRSVEREKAFLEQVLDIAGAAICIVNLDGLITTVNGEFTAITGYTREMALGRPRDELLRGEETSPGRPDASGPEPSKHECRIRTAAGKEITILRNAAPLRDVHGDPVGSIESFVDISEIVRARTDAEQASRMKSMFLANMSHEIRTPLNALIGIPQLLARTEITPEQHEYVETMRATGSALLNIVNDILDISKIEAGRMEIVAGPVDLGRLLAEAVHLMSAPATEKGLALTWSMDPDLPLILETDPFRLRQILLNLLSNAVKFTDSGKVGLSATLSPDETSVRFQVTDTGPGIARDDTEHVFEPFYQADGSVTRRHGGTGLGLSISRRLAILLGAPDLFLRSEPGRGCAFFFDLPLRSTAPDPGNEPLDAPDDEPSADEAARADLSALRVLVAEDNDFNRFLLGKILDKLGVCETAFAADGEGAVEMVLERAAAGQPFDVLFIDLRMPGLDGASAARRLRRAGIVTPVVALTAQAMARDAALCREAGMDYFFSKPYRIRDIEKVLTTVAASRQGAWP